MMTRRAFVNWMLGTSAGALVVAVLYPVSRYLIPPQVAESTTSTVTLKIDPAALQANTGQVFRFGSKPAILVKTASGELRAFSAVCTHLGCTVQYRPDLRHLWCACHNGHFDLEGRNIAGPPPRPLERLTVKVSGSEVQVSKGG